MPAGQTILIVEDDEQVRRMYRMALEFEGYEILEAGDGLEALRIIDAKPPDLVLLDLNLPTVSGVVVRQDIAARARTRHIPIVVVTGSAENLDYLEVECVLKKPVLPDLLVETVRKCIDPGMRGPVSTKT